MKNHAPVSFLYDSFLIKKQCPHRNEISRENVLEMQIFNTSEETTHPKLSMPQQSLFKQVPKSQLQVQIRKHGFLK